MGRPRKNPDQAEDTSPEGVADEPGSEAPAVKVDAPLPDLKACPVCGSPAKAPYLDIHGLYRCHCSHEKCGFGDCYPRYTPLEAAEMWNAIGGPSKLE